MRTLILTALAAFALATSALAANNYSENFGVVTATTPIATWTGYQMGAPVVYTGTGDLRVTTVSSGYAAASGGTNVFITNTAGKNLQIAGINTAAVSTARKLQFGLYKSATAETGANMKIEYSTDGTNFTTMTFPSLGTSASWYYVTANETLPASTNLTLRFTQQAAVAQFRIDDILIGDTYVPPPPVTGTIADVKAAANGARFTDVTGIVTSVGGSTSRLQFTIQDATGGVLVDCGTQTYTQPTLGDQVKLGICLKTLNGAMVQLAPEVGASAYTTLSSGNALPAPVQFASLTAFLAANSLDTQSKLVRVKNVYCSDTAVPTNGDAVNWMGAAATGNINYVYTDDGATTIQVRITSDVHGKEAIWRAKPRSTGVAQKVDVVGVGSAYGTPVVNQIYLNDPAGTTAMTDATGPIYPAGSAVRDWFEY